MFRFCEDLPRRPCARLPEHITFPCKEILANLPFRGNAPSKNISQLLLPAGIHHDAYIVLRTAIATDVLLHRGWHYLSCPWCSSQVSVKGGTVSCSECGIKVDDAIARF